MTIEYDIREIQRSEYETLGKLMIDIYSKLDGFPTCAEQPAYYDMLANIGKFNDGGDTSVLVAVTTGGALTGGVVYFGNMADYGSGGTATTVKNASGIRLLGVDHRYRKAGIGKGLTLACIEQAKARGHDQVILHTTQAMRVAWDLYLAMGFERSEDLDFLQEALPVFGFRLKLGSR